MTYEYALKKIKDMENFGSKPGLERIRLLMNFIGNPQNKLKCIHVAGTNGKGSVCFALETILRSEGYKTGLYISPSISDFRERISINGVNIGKKALTDIFSYLEPILAKKEFKNDPITEFELTTAMAFKFFHDDNCDIAIIETGMGGKLDATNIITKPVCSILTSISLDHTKILGDTTEKITTAKCGIIKPNCPVVVCDKQPEKVYEIIKNTCESNNSVLKKASITELENKKSESLNGISFTYKCKNINTKIMGNHQFINLSCALKTIETIKNNLHVKIENVQNSLQTLTIPCRLELIGKNPTVILDAAHNPDGIAKLTDFLKQNCNYKKIYGIVGMFKDKDCDTSFKHISELFETIYTITPKNKRAETLGKITACARKYSKNVVPCKSIKSALDLALSSASPDD
ncbi:MAG: bifunctional folylpolyglutamate synthase/dihydrofolate synthase, partial [Clostridia bacterium]|nr:bifunctional folylpolyglutamate synthase/dihydrofolate synthase [Clostridia bacterium]MBR2734686.1 bifunctional folylpolyglutamate synthase/dihydrofolate synthase [Clostridia bacterium]